MCALLDLLYRWVLSDTTLATSPASDWKRLRPLSLRTLNLSLSVSSSPSNLTLGPSPALTLLLSSDLSWDPFLYLAKLGHMVTV